MKKKVKIIIGIVIAAIAALAVGVFAFYLHIKTQPGFIKGTTLNGTDISGQTANQVANTVAEQYKDSEVVLNEDGETAMTGTLSDFGYTFDNKALEATLDSAYEAQREDPLTIFEYYFKGDALTIDTANDFDEDTFEAKVVSSDLAEPRVESKEASVQFDEAKETYYVDKAVQGNEIDDVKLQKAVKEAIDEAIGSVEIEDKISFDIPESVYTSKKVSTDTAALEQEAKDKNDEYLLKQYDSAKVNYTFGNETVTLDSETIKSWLTVSDGTVTVDDDAIAEYVDSLADKYNTRYLDRTFRTTAGATITISGSLNEYGYTIDEESECAQLKADILSHTEVTREPIYYESNSYGNPYYYQRNGVDDLAGNYVEVDLTKQHLWFYVNGSLVVESDIVSGDVSENAETQTGVFPLAYKESPSVLTGPNGDGTNYESPVQYWMPFFEGEGLHDAPWKSSFGGDIYKTDGSHGCVNLPTDVAGTIYNNIQAGMAIVIYKS